MRGASTSPSARVIPGMAYLVRRLLENTSNESWLRAGFLDKASPESLLAPPHHAWKSDPGLERTERAAERHVLSDAPAGVGDDRPFYSEPMRDFADAGRTRRVHRRRLSARLPAVANDGTVRTLSKLERAAAAFTTWRDADPRTRAAPSSSGPRR